MYVSQGDLKESSPSLRMAFAVRGSLPQSMNRHERYRSCRTEILRFENVLQSRYRTGIFSVSQRLTTRLISPSPGNRCLLAEVVRPSSVSCLPAAPQTLVPSLSKARFCIARESRKPPLVGTLTNRANTAGLRSQAALDSQGSQGRLDFLSALSVVGSAKQAFRKCTKPSTV